MGPRTSSGSAVLDSGTRELTRAVPLFSLAGRMRPDGSRPGALVDRYDYGRFEPHLRTSENVLPVPVLAHRATPDDLHLPHGGHGLDLASVDIAFAATPRGDVTLVLDCQFAADSEPAALAARLADTCFERARISLGDRPLLDVLNERLTSCSGGTADAPAGSCHRPTAARPRRCRRPGPRPGADATMCRCDSTVSLSEVT
ncbi:hypothetical protein [Streptomyces plumbiresistens]|uniref:Condensation domain-containing protein n=1 Tax=Streptomyces plumbiresistens TaxID=511811 RepID=A0ABP7QQL9_9ACTN